MKTRDHVVDKQKKRSGTGRAVGGRERRSTAAVSRNAGLARLPGSSLISRSVWTAVALAPLCCLTGSGFDKDIIPMFCFRFPGAAAKNRKKCLISPRIGNK
jgi:hypothetical protein